MVGLAVAFCHEWRGATVQNMLHVIALIYFYYLFISSMSFHLISFENIDKQKQKKKHDSSITSFLFFCFVLWCCLDNIFYELDWKCKSLKNFLFWINPKDGPFEGSFFLGLSIWSPSSFHISRTNTVLI